MARLTLAFFVALFAYASARMAYQLPADSETILHRSLQETFDCEGRSYGYYADVANDCQVFHVCLPIADEIGALLETAHFSFVCGNGTVFSQDSLTCAHPEYAFPCDQAESLYDIANAEFGVIPEDVK